VIGRGLIIGRQLWNCQKRGSHCAYHTAEQEMSKLVKKYSSQKVIQFKYCNVIRAAFGYSALGFSLETPASRPCLPVCRTHIL
jgi:hypothetical protein